jgi:hypothetical protein
MEMKTAGQRRAERGRATAQKANDKADWQAFVQKKKKASSKEYYEWRVREAEKQSKRDAIVCVLVAAAVAALWLY